MDIPRRILERRRSVRISESFLFKVSHQGRQVQAITVNLSSHGVLGIVEKDIPMMSRLDITLQLPGGASKVVRAKGVVVRKEKDARTGRYLIAIYFSDLKLSDRKRFEKFINRYLKTP